MTISAIPLASAASSVGSTSSLSGATPAAPGVTISAAIPAPPVLVETPQAQAITVATAVAAARQSGLAVLLADLSQAIANPSAPAPVQAAVAQVLSLQTPIDPPPTAADLQQAVAASGLFLEAQLAEGSIPTPANDLKAALLVVQQVLQAWTESAPAADQASAATTASPPPLPPTAVTSPPSSLPASSLPPVAALDPAQAAPSVALQSANAAPETPGPRPITSATQTPQIEATQITEPQTTASETTAPTQTAALQTSARDPTERANGPTLPPPPAALNPPSLVAATPAPAVTPEPVVAPQPAPAPEAPATPLPATPLPLVLDLGAPTSDDAPILTYGLIDVAAADGASGAATPSAAASTAAPSASATPPPPFRGGPTTGQAPASPILNAGVEPAALARRLLTETTGALARTELHQIASVPDAPSDRPPSETGPRWMFELPLATPQGSAVAQFEISRDGGGPGASDSEPTWRARFSIDLEPMGPVHVQVALTGTRAGVTLWAERPAVADRLRTQQAGLNQGLESAAFTPAVSIFIGAPPRAPARAGRFLDQAS